MQCSRLHECIEMSYAGLTLLPSVYRRVAITAWDGTRRATGARAPR
jgi:hypothetical protein